MEDRRRGNEKLGGESYPSKIDVLVGELTPYTLLYVPCLYQKNIESKGGNILSEILKLIEEQ